MSEKNIKLYRDYSAEFKHNALLQSAPDGARSPRVKAVIGRWILIAIFVSLKEHTMNIHTHYKLQLPVRLKKWLLVLYNFVLIITGSYFSSRYLIGNPFSKPQSTPVVAALMIVWATGLLIRDIRYAIRFHDRSLAIFGQCLLWFGALLVQLWSTFSFPKDNLVAAFGALAAAISGIIGIAALVSYSKPNRM